MYHYVVGFRKLLFSQNNFFCVIKLQINNYLCETRLYFRFKSKIQTLISIKLKIKIS